MMINLKGEARPEPFQIFGTFTKRYSMSRYVFKIGAKIRFHHNSSCFAAPMSIAAEISRRLDVLKNKLNKWESSFESQHGRSAGSDDVKKCGLGIPNLFDFSFVQSV
jgi:hypothetical protein